MLSEGENKKFWNIRNQKSRNSRYGLPEDFLTKGQKTTGLKGSVDLFTHPLFHGQARRKDFSQGRGWGCTMFSDFIRNLFIYSFINLIFCVSNSFSLFLSLIYHFIFYIFVFFLCWPFLTLHSRNVRTQVSLNFFWGGEGIIGKCRLAQRFVPFKGKQGI